MHYSKNIIIFSIKYSYRPVHLLGALVGNETIVIKICIHVYSRVPFNKQIKKHVSALSRRRHLGTFGFFKLFMINLHIIQFITFPLLGVGLCPPLPKRNTFVNMAAAAQSPDIIYWFCVKENP